MENNTIDEQLTDTQKKIQKKYDLIQKRLEKVRGILENDIKGMREQYPELKELSYSGPTPIICEKLDEIKTRAKSNFAIIRLADECKYLAKLLKISTVIAIYKKLMREMDGIDKE